jgi:excisionase family DNA binding protein
MTTAAYRLLSAAEVARVLNVSRETVLRYVAEGHLSSIRVGEKGRHRFRPEDIDRLLRGGGGP